MALTKCSECYQDVSERADACPNCGNPIRKAAAKKHSKFNLQMEMASGAVLGIIGGLLASYLFSPSIFGVRPTFGEWVELVAKAPDRFGTTVIVCAAVGGLLGFFAAAAIQAARRQ